MGREVLTTVNRYSKCKLQIQPSPLTLTTNIYTPLILSSPPSLLADLSPGKIASRPTLPFVLFLELTTYVLHLHIQPFSLSSQQSHPHLSIHFHHHLPQGVEHVQSIESIKRRHIGNQPQSYGIHILHPEPCSIKCPSRIRSQALILD